MLAVTKFTELVLVSGLPFLCGGTQALFSVVPSRGLSQSFAVGVSRTCTRLTRRVVSLSSAEQKSSHSIAVGVSRTCTRLTRHVVSQSPRFACLHI